MAAVTIASLSVAQAAPLAFQHTGRLLDTTGTPVNASNVTLTVSLSTSDGGTSYWSQDFTNLTLADGYFAVQVGGGSPALDSTDLDHDEVWLTTSFTGGSSISQRLLSVPYAARAEVAEVAQSLASSQGSVVQMTTVQTRQQGTYSAPTSGNGAAISPMNIVTTPRKAGNHVLLEWDLNGEIDYNSVFVVTRNGVILPNASNGSNNRWAGVSSGLYDQDTNSTPSTYRVSIIDTDSLDSETTYSVHARSSGTANLTFYLNRTAGANNTNNHEATLSVGTATEIWQD